MKEILKGDTIEFVVNENILPIKLNKLAGKRLGGRVYKVSHINEEVLNPITNLKEWKTKTLYDIALDIETSILFDYALGSTKMSQFTLNSNHIEILYMADVDIMIANLEKLEEKYGKKNKKI